MLEGKHDVREGAREERRHGIKEAYSSVNKRLFQSISGSPTLDETPATGRTWKRANSVKLKLMRRGGEK